MNKIDKKMKKVRKKLGYKYYLYEDSLGNWKLFRTFDAFDRYITEDNDSIMSNKTHTIDDLYKFAKTHHKIDYEIFEGEIFIIMSFIVLVLNVINVFIKSRLFYGFTWGICFMIILISFIKTIIMDKNHKVFLLEHKEQMELFDK